MRSIIVTLICVLAALVTIGMLTRGDPPPTRSDGMREPAPQPARSVSEVRPAALPATVEEPADDEPLVTGPTSGITIRGQVVTANEREPVTGALVHVAPLLRTAVSDAEGKFVLDSLRPGRAGVYVRGGGWVSPALVASRRATPASLTVDLVEDMEIVLTAVPTGSVRAVVTNDEGNPLTGRILHVTQITEDPVTETGRPYRGPHGPQCPMTTDEAGSAVMEDLVPGFEYEVCLRAPDGADLNTKRVVAVSGRRVDVELLEPPPKFQEILVLFEDTDEPVPGVLVRFVTGPEAPLKTDQRGRAKIPAERSVEELVFLGHEGIIEPRDGHPLLEDGLTTIRVARGTFAAGTVIWADGKPAEGAAIYILDHRQHKLGTGYSASDGTFRITGLGRDRRWGIHAVAQKSGAGYNAYCEGIPGFDRHTLRLVRRVATREGGVQFSILGPDGRPVESCEALLWSYPAGRHHGLSLRNSISVRNGALHRGFPNRPSPMWIEIVDARQPDRRCGSTVVGPFDPEPGEHITIRLPEEARVIGSVVDAGGYPVGGTKVHLYSIYDRLPRRISCHVRHGSGTTTADGAFSVGGLGKGEYHLQVVPPAPLAPPPTMRIRSPNKSLRIEVRKGISPTLTILHPDGSPLEGARVSVNSNGFSAFSGATGKDGTVQPKLLDPVGPYRLRIDSPHTRTLDGHVQKEWRPCEVTISLRAPAGR
jgi:Carboxypeptidase regulatory-like domain